MLVAIVTKRLPPTNFKGTRIKAKCAAGAITIEWDWAESIEGNHRRAAMQLVREVDWTVKAGYEGQWVGGTIANCTYDYAFCLVNTNNSFRVD
jgi:hypothetical protein